MPHNETDVASDFYGFLNNFYNVFADMKKKDLVIFGESYAGAYKKWYYIRCVICVVCVRE